MIRFALAAAAASLAFAGPAIAKDGSWRVGNDEIHIVYSDIDPNSPAGRAILLARVERAASKLCGNEIVRVIRQDCFQSVMETSAANPRNTTLRRALAEKAGASLAAR